MASLDRVQSISFSLPVSGTVNSTVNCLSSKAVSSSYLTTLLEPHVEALRLALLYLSSVVLVRRGSPLTSSLKSTTHPIDSLFHRGMTHAA